MIVIALASLAVAAAPATPLHVPVDGKETHGVSEFEAERYGNLLRAMDEAPLFRRDAKSKTRVYRFIYVPTFDNPLTVQLTVDGEQVEIDGRRLEFDHVHQVARLSERASRKLTADDAKEFAALFAKLNFPKLPSRVSDEGCDGSEWILEAAEGDSYHVISRWTPMLDTKTRGLANFVAVCSWLYRKSPLTGDAMHQGDVEISRDAGH